MNTYLYQQNLGWHEDVNYTDSRTYELGYTYYTFVRNYAALYYPLYIHWDSQDNSVFRVDFAQMGIIKL